MEYRIVASNGRIMESRSSVGADGAQICPRHNWNENLVQELRSDPNALLVNFTILLKKRRTKRGCIFPDHWGRMTTTSHQDRDGRQKRRHDSCQRDERENYIPDYLIFFLKFVLFFKPAQDGKNEQRHSKWNSRCFQEKNRHFSSLKDLNFINWFHFFGYFTQ